MKQAEQIKTNNKMVDLKSNLSAITLNVNGLNVPIKTHRLLEDKNKTNYMLFTRDKPQCKDAESLKIRG